MAITSSWSPLWTFHGASRSSSHWSVATDLCGGCALIAGTTVCLRLWPRWQKSGRHFGSSPYPLIDLLVCQWKCFLLLNVPLQTLAVPFIKPVLPNGSFVYFSSFYKYTTKWCHFNHILWYKWVSPKHLICNYVISSDLNFFDKHAVCVKFHDSKQYLFFITALFKSGAFGNIKLCWPNVKPTQNWQNCSFLLFR